MFKNPIQPLNFEQVTAWKAFRFLTEAVDPYGLEAEGRRLADIPGIGGKEEDFACFGLKSFHCKLVDPWIRFKDPDILHGQDSIQEILETGVPHSGRKHLW